jgi:signal-transduction protein with cAMP-binding, CBS, and nucleotidyltransferase domain
MFIGTVCSRTVNICSTNANAQEIAAKMRGEHVGDLIVVEDRSGESVPVGIVTDRDLVMEVMAKNLDPVTVKASDVMSRELITAYEGEELDVALERMRWSGVRRIPILDSAGNLVGIATFDDILEKLAITLTNLSHVSKVQCAEERTVKQ